MSEPLPRGVAAVTVFVSSGSVLVLEILALRLIAPYVGVTLQTNTAVIGMALGAIALGVWTGGRLADVVDPRRVLPPLVVLAGGLTLLTLPIVRFAGAALGGADPTTVVLLAACAVFAPAALLSAVTPMVVKLQLADLRRTGEVVGSLSGVGTLGAIVATFATGFVLVAALPSSVIVFGLGGLLVAGGVGLWWLLRRSPGHSSDRSPGRPAVLAGVVVVAAGLTVFAPQPCDVETAYHCAAVAGDPARPSGRELHLDTLRHSYVDLRDLTYLEFSYVQGIASIADVLRPAGQPVRALHLGGGGMTLPRYLAAARPGSRSVVLEVDGGVVDLVRRELPTRPEADIRVRVGDARVLVRDEPTGSYDLVVGDAFGGIAVPWHLTTVDMIEQVQRVLTPDGVYAANVIDRPPAAFLRAEIATVRAVFPHVAVLAPPAYLEGRDGGNFVVVASDRPLPVDAALDRARQRGTGYAALEGAALARFVGDAEVLTDDHAPVDQLITPFG